MKSSSFIYGRVTIMSRQQVYSSAETLDHVRNYYSRRQRAQSEVRRNPGGRIVIYLFDRFLYRYRRRLVINLMLTSLIQI